MRMWQEEMRLFSGENRWRRLANGRSLSSVAYPDGVLSTLVEQLAVASALRLEVPRRSAVGRDAGASPIMNEGSSMSTSSFDHNLLREGMGVEHLWGGRSNWELLSRPPSGSDRLPAGFLGAKVLR